MNQERYRGALLGLAIGDALGMPVEFKEPGSFPPVTTLIGGGRHNLKPGYWTDDTAMALCLADSLLSCQGYDATDQIACYLRWYQDGYLSSTGQCFDIGNTVRTALESYSKTNQPYSGSTHPRSAGNGSIMRLAPVVLAFALNPGLAINLAADSSRTTHGATEAINSCCYLAALLIGALQGQPKEALISPHYSPLPAGWQTPLTPKLAAIAAGSYQKKNPPEIRGTGYVVDSLEAALWAFYHSNNFAEGALLAVNLGEDADTTGAVYGQLAGAYYGVSDIPGDWLRVLQQREYIQTQADKLLELAQSQKQ
ncbi:MAG: ADP-ribosylation/Crystallin [Firmicutes bacterium]|nr:ADP-ribosylation/Crystallin [Bacillota bacterium]